MVSYSPTIKEYTSLFYLSSKDIKLIYYMIYNDATLLHQKLMILKKFMKKNQPILTVINVWRQCLQVKRIILPNFSP